MRVLALLLLLWLVERNAAANDNNNDGPPSSSPCPSRVPSDQTCPQGCYQASGKMNSDGSRPCEPVGIGNYSPGDDNRRYPCEFGTYSSHNAANACTHCPAGFYSSSAGAFECEICPLGTYSNLPRSIFCSPCDPEFYDGDGANAIQVWDGKVYCDFTTPSQTAQTKTTGASPTMAPSLESANLPVTPPPSDATVVETIAKFGATNELQDEQPEEDEEDEWCLKSEYEWHDECTTCPSTLRSILHPLWMVTVLVATITALACLPTSSAAIVWMGIEYLQLAFFLGLVPMHNVERHFILEHLRRWILSVFAMDLDAGLAWQCMMGLSASVDHMFVLLLPMVVACLVWIIVQAFPRASPRVGKWIAIGFSLGHFKLVLTSLEALHCSGNDWFCRDPLLSSIVGVIGLALYGAISPFWILWTRYRHFKASSLEEIDMAWSRDLGFEHCWWWPGFWILRRSLLATLPVVLLDQASWILTGFLVALMASELVQRFASPFATDSSDELSNRWFRLATVDTVLQASIIGLTGLSFLALAMPPETMRADGVVIAILFLTLWIPSVAYWMAAMIYSYLHFQFEDEADQVESQDDAKSNTSASTTSSSRQRKYHSREAAPPTTTNVTTKSKPFPPPAPPSINNVEDTALHHSLSLIPSTGPGDDLDIETILADHDEEEADLPTWRRSEAYSQWVGTGDLAIRSVLRNRPIATSLRSEDDGYLPPSLPSQDGTLTPPPHLGYDNDDTSTLTDNNTYASRPAPRQHYHTMRPRPLEYHVAPDPDASSLMESSGDGTPMIFSDDNDDEGAMEYYVSHHYHHHHHHPPSQDYRAKYDDDDSDDVTEVWIDEATGLPVVDKQPGEWADVTTGKPVDSVSSSSSTSSSRFSKKNRSRSSRKSS